MEVKINWDFYQNRIWGFLNSKNPDNFNDKLEVLYKNNDDFFSEEEKKNLNEKKHQILFQLRLGIYGNTQKTVGGVIIVISKELYKIKKRYFDKEITKEEYERILNKIKDDVDWDLFTLKRDLKNVG